VPSGLIAFQQLKPVARRDGEIIQPHRGIERLQFPLDDAPQLPRYSTSGARVPLSKEIGCGPVSERPDHTYYTLHV
jgi:hypothetical protein